MAKMKVLITVKTYPTLSEKYDELVCTAGITEDGRWIRIYPIPFRKLDYEQQYPKWSIVEVDLVKNSSDFRPESYKPASLDNPITIIKKIDTKNNWEERKKWVLKDVRNDLQALIDEAKDENKQTSLATFKPSKIYGMIVESLDREWDKDKLKAIKDRQKQGNLFEGFENPFEVVNKLPYKFSYEFEDSKGKRSTLMVEDWEIGQLYWNCLKRNKGDEQKACEEVVAKYEGFIKNNDIYFFLGTTLEFHRRRAHNPFIIIGVFLSIKTKRRPSIKI
jgi:hypothetical protein